MNVIDEVILFDFRGHIFTNEKYCCDVMVAYS